MEEGLIQNTLMFLGFVVALIGGIFTAFKYFSAEIKAARQAAEDTTRQAIEAEQRARHSLANTVQVMSGKIDAEMKEIEGRTVQLALDAARKSDLDKLEQRFTEVVRDIKTALTSEIRRQEEARQASVDRLDVKLDALTAKITEFMVAHSVSSKRAPSRSE